MKNLLALALFLLLSGCVASSMYYTADDPSLATNYKSCHSFGSMLHPIQPDERIRTAFTVSVESQTKVKLDFTFFLFPKATFILLDKNFTVILPAGEQILLPIQRVPGGVSYNIPIENGVPIAAPSSFPGEYGWGPIGLFANFEPGAQLTKKITLVTPRFQVNDVIYPSRRLLLHLESRTGLDLCEG